MIRVINKKTYNTETATALGTATEGSPYRDFTFVEETLYQTAKGAYFVAGSGGPDTRYAVATGNNNYSGSSAITPMTRSEAYAWAEEHGLTKTILAHFADLTEAA